MLFYRQGQATVVSSLERLKSMGIPTKRPEDYYAQMAKTDDHMQRIRSKLAQKQEEEERIAKVRKLRELKKFGKQVQIEVQQKRQKEKKDMMDQVKKFRKGKTDKIDFLDEIEVTKGKKPFQKNGKRYVVFIIH
jgi:rRNA-processing protein EBP2